MRYIKTYEQLINESKRFKDVDLITLDWCNDNITEKEFFSYIENLSINEGWFESAKQWLVDAGEATVNWFKEKFFKILMTMLKNAVEVGMVIINKVMQFVNWVFEKLNKFADKNPIVWKIILITLIMFICLVVCASSVKAQTTGQPIDPNVINSAIGMLKAKMGSGGDNQLYMKAMAYLVDIRDGHQDINPEVVGKGAIDLGNSALSIIDDFKKSTNSDFTQYAASSIKEGANYVGAEITKMGGVDSVKLFIK
jgi:hypothetical protein